ncbi:hypothetical protein [Maribacter sp.]|uniref:hypothetical protein n=1 Tax=Maribacter sp. TaxID=1897614 RepID=UPI0025B80F21|nr:hypothetical protein [Maribacter sp.]
MKHSLLCIAFLFSIMSQSLGQIVTDVQLLDSYSAVEISSAVSFVRIAEYAVDIYKVNYLTPDVQGESSVASGIICIPRDNTSSFPLASYQHGTVGGREDVPSRLGSNNYVLPLVFAGAGFVTCSADYLGLGDSSGIHPYVHAATEASASLDLMRAAVELSNDPDFATLFNLNDQVFVAGYSQGGHATMALQREIELNANDEFQLAASAPMSGPYSVSESMVDFTLGDDNYGFVAYVAWITLGYQAAYPETLGMMTLEDVFKSQYIDHIREFEAETINLWTLNNLLAQTLIDETGGQRPKDMFHDSIVNSILANPTSPFAVALADNDTYDWTPEATTYLCYCHGDEQVTFENSLLAERVMSDNGATTVELIRMDTDDAPLDHSGCGIPCHLETYDRFKALSNITSSVTDLDVDQVVRFSYNDGSLITELTETMRFDSYELRLYNYTGQLLSKHTLANKENQVSVNHLDQGLYIAELAGLDNKISTFRFFKD